MEPHKYRVGQIVRFTKVYSTTSRSSAPVGTFRVVGLMPEYLGSNQYRLQSTTDGHQRVVMENEIDLG